MNHEFICSSVYERLQALNDDPKVLVVWNKFVNQEIKPTDIDDKF